MVVYLDVVWLLNFLFDCLLLFLTAIFLKRRIKPWKLVFGGFIGSLIILLSFTPLHAFSSHPFAKLFISVLMILAVFGYKRWQFFIKGLLTLYFSTFLLGGTLIGVHYFIQYDSELTTNIVLSNIKGFGDPISWLFVIVGFPIAWYFSKAGIERMEMAKIQFDQIVSVILIIDNERFVFSGLIDSGNQLYDPLTKMPVMFVSVKNQLDVIPESIKKIACEPESYIMGNSAFPDEWQSRLRVVPCSVVGQEHQLIVAIKPDVIMIKKEDDVFRCEKGLVSFTIQQLSSDDVFQCIVHPKMLTGAKYSSEAMKVS